MRVSIERKQHYFLETLTWILVALLFFYEFFLRVFSEILSIILIPQFNLNVSQLILLASSYYAAILFLSWATRSALYLQITGLYHLKTAMVIFSMWFGLSVDSTSVYYIFDVLKLKNKIINVLYH